MQCTAVFQKRNGWYLGWVEEIPGVNSQGKTLKETKSNLKEALEMILEANKAALARARPRGKVIRIQPFLDTMKLTISSQRKS